MSRDGFSLNDKIGRPQLKIVRRASGQNALRSAAYNARAAMTDEQTGERYNYEWRDDCDHVEIIGWGGDAADLWNAAEAAERKSNSQVARNIILPLPADLPKDEMIRLGRDYAEWLHEEYGTASMIALHRPDPKTDRKTGETGDNQNWHIHLLETTRRVKTDADGRQTLGEKTREMTDTNAARKGEKSRSKVELRKRRDTWEEMTNAALARSGVAYRVDFSAYADQVKEGRRAPQEPTEHLGPILHKSRRDRQRDGASQAPRKIQGNRRRKGRNQVSARAVRAVLDDVMAVKDYAAARDEPADIAEDFFRSARRQLAKNRAKAAERKRRKAEKDRERARMAAEKARAGRAAEDAATTPEKDEAERKRQAAIARRTNERRGSQEAPQGGTRDTSLAEAFNGKDKKQQQRKRRRQRTQ